VLFSRPGIHALLRSAGCEVSLACFGKDVHFALGCSGVKVFEFLFNFYACRELQNIAEMS